MSRPYETLAPSFAEEGVAPLTSIRNSVRDPKRGGLAPGLSPTSFLLEAFHAPEDGSAVALALATRPAPGASPPCFGPPDNFASGLTLARPALDDSMSLELVRDIRRGTGKSQAA